MFISDVTLGTINRSMTRVVETGYGIAQRVEQFSQVANEINKEVGSSANMGDENGLAQTDISSAIGELSKQVARYQVLGRMASAQLGLYALVASDGKA